jgi:hypothetical protein
MKTKSIWISIAIIIAALLAFHFFTRQEGRIKIDTDGVEMQLRSGWFSKIRITSGADPATVNARVYRPRSISLAGQKGGNEWIINGFGPWGKLAKIKVKEDQTTVLKPGPPFNVKTNVRRRGQNLSIGLLVIGQAGEHYSAEVRTRRGSLPAPRLKIVDESGKVLVSDKFKFG